MQPKKTNHRVGGGRARGPLRWHPTLIEFVKKYIKEAHAGDSKMFVHRLKTTTQRVSMALRRSAAEAINELNRRAKGYPSVALQGAADAVVGV